MTASHLNRPEDNQLRLKHEDCKFAGICRYYEFDSSMCRDERKAINICDDYHQFVMIVEKKRASNVQSVLDR